MKEFNFEITSKCIVEELEDNKDFKLSSKFNTTFTKKHADTIEELCDCFLVEYKNGEHMVFKDFYQLKGHYDLYNQKYFHITGRYGCIWVVGKGLIYVAKMNEKGELELI